MKNLTFDYSRIESPKNGESLVISTEEKSNFENRVFRNWAPVMEELLQTGTNIIVRIKSRSPLVLGGTMAVPPYIVGK